MPIKDSNDPHGRFRSPTPPLRRSGFISDIRPTQKRVFPNVGTTLPPRRDFTAPVRPISRPNQPIPQRQAVVPKTQPARTPASPAPSQPLPREVPANTATQRAPKRKRKFKIFTKKRLALLIILIILGVGGWVGGKLFLNVQKVFHGNVFSVLTTTKLKGEDVGRVNILLAGNSADDPGHDGANLTDSIMVVSIDTKNNTAFMLSVPRDLWVAIPGYGHAKINEAYVDGETGNFSAPGYPNGGMGLLAEVIKQNLGISTDYYALIDYNAVRDAVDAIGGIDVNIQSDDPRGLYDPSIDWSTHGPLVKLTNGVHHITGEQALDLARARGDTYGAYGFARSDFERTANQRMMMLAIKSKVLTAGVLANPIALGNLFDSVGKNVHTDFTLSDVRRLYSIGKNINNSNITSVGLDNADGVNLLSNYTSPTNESALIPKAGLDDFSAIQAFLSRIMSDNPIVREDAKVFVLNGTNTSGLASQKEKLLIANNINVRGIGDALTTVATTTIIDASGGQKPATLAYLKQTYGTSATTTNPYANTYDADFIIVLGNDQVPTATVPAQ